MFEVKEKIKQKNTFNGKQNIHTLIHYKPSVIKHNDMTYSIATANCNVGLWMADGCTLRLIVHSLAEYYVAIT